MKKPIIKKNTPSIIGPNKKSVLDVFKKIAKKKSPNNRNRSLDKVTVMKVVLSLNVMAMNFLFL